MLRGLVGIALCLLPTVAMAEDEVKTIPPGDDNIVVVHKGDVAPFTGQLFDGQTAVRWALWLQQYKQLIPLHDAHAQAICKVDLDHAAAVQAIDLKEAQTVQVDLKTRLLKTETERQALEHPPWYSSGLFLFMLGAVSATTLIVVGKHTL